MTRVLTALCVGNFLVIILIVTIGRKSIENVSRSTPYIFKFPSVARNDKKRTKSLITLIISLWLPVARGYQLHL